MAAPGQRSLLLTAIARGLVTLRNAVAILLPAAAAENPSEWLTVLMGPPSDDLALGDQETLRGFQRLLAFDFVWPRVCPILQVRGYDPPVVVARL
jgi:hypothetical protein